MDDLAAARHAHAMPFGAALQEDGRVRFALWAPGARRVQLALSGTSGQRTLEVPALEDATASMTISRCPIPPRAATPTVCTARAW